MRQYYLTDRETESFYELLEIKKDLIWSDPKKLDLG